MRTIDIFDAQSTLSDLVDALALGGVESIVITRDSRPVAKLVAVDATKQPGP